MKNEIKILNHAHAIEIIDKLCNEGMHMIHNFNVKNIKLDAKQYIENGGENLYIVYDDVEFSLITKNK